MKEYDADPDGEGRPLRCCEEWFVSRLCQSSLGVGDPRALLDTTVMVRRRGGRRGEGEVGHQMPARYEHAN